MITIERKPTDSENNREIINMELPNDNDPEAVVSFVYRFMTAMGIEMAMVPPEMLEAIQQQSIESEEEDTPQAIGFMIPSKREDDDED